MVKAANVNMKIDFNKFNIPIGANAVMVSGQAMALSEQQQVLYEQIINKINEIRDVPTSEGYISETLFKEVVNSLCTELTIDPIYPDDIPENVLMYGNQMVITDETDGEYITYE
jgi:hypothetical protein